MEIKSYVFTWDEIPHFVELLNLQDIDSRNSGNISLVRFTHSHPMHASERWYWWYTNSCPVRGNETQTVYTHSYEGTIFTHHTESAKRRFEYVTREGMSNYMLLCSVVVTAHPWHVTSQNVAENIRFGKCLIWPSMPNAHTFRIMQWSLINTRPNIKRYYT